MKPIAALLAGILAVTAGGGQETSMTASELNAEAVKAYQGKDYGRFLAYEKRALDLDPTNERFIYNVACGEALLGNAREAVRLLGRLLADKLDFGAETDSDFEGIRGTPEWDAFKKQLAELRKPVVRSRAAFILPDPNLLATGIAVDPARGDVFIASVRERKIVRRKRDGTISDFIQQAQDGFLRGIPLRWIPLGIFSMRRLPQFLTCWATSNKILAARECLRLILNQASWRERPCSRPMASAICSTRWWSITMVPCMFPTRAHRAFTCYSLVQAN